MASDQKEIAAVILQKLHEWMVCKDLSSFQPLRMTVFGEAGTGKSVLIKTLLSVIRQIFSLNDVVQTVSSSFISAANVHGETCTEFTGIPSECTDCNEAMPMRRNMMKVKLQLLLCLFIDDKELLSIQSVGFLENIVRNTAYDGIFNTSFFGKIPIVVMFGNDANGLIPHFPNVWYSLCEGNESRKMTPQMMKFKDVFIKCTQTTMSLTLPKRNKNIHDMNMIQQMQQGFLSYLNDKKLQKLNIANVVRELGVDYATDLRSRATINCDSICWGDACSKHKRTTQTCITRKSNCCL